jgi:hypothetical protein
MGWEARRNGRLYYYAKHREGGRVRSVYLGTGPHIERLVAAERALSSATASATRAARRERELAEAELDDVACLLDEYGRLCQSALADVLERAGFHHRRGEWRRCGGRPPRDRSDDPQAGGALPPGAARRRGRRT